LTYLKNKNPKETLSLNEGDVLIMDKIIISGGLSFFIAFFSIPVIIQVAKEKKLFDQPDERKWHKSIIPTLGGLGIFAGFAMSVILATPHSAAVEFQPFLAACMIIFFLGLKDDILVLSPSKKFIGQIVAAFVLIKLGGIKIDNFQGTFGLNYIPPISSDLVTLLTIVLIVNSFNLIDGLDGLAGSLGVLTTAVFGIFFTLTNNIPAAVMAFSLTGALLAFLIYNFPPAKIFMGDTGSLILGLVNAVLVIHFINAPLKQNLTLLKFNAAPALGFAILMVPLFDTLRVFTLRILKRRSPFSPDRNHIHHLLMDAGFGDRSITLICLIFNVVYISTAYFLQTLGNTMLFIVLFGMGIAFTSFIFLLKQKKIKQNNAKSEKNPLKVVSDHAKAG
jgi:UDP-N-acetylmuramyl pentapeptide phosphotransferase/UDP-N-acetylglucosamine-1-phosphate transferase